MNSYESICSKLSPMSLYSLDTDSIVNKEILSYCEVLDDICIGADELLRESFLDTAQSFGLAEYEKICRTGVGKNTGERRKMLLAKTGTRQTDISMSSIIRSISSLGIEVELTENINNQTVTVKVLNDVASDKINFIKQEIRKIIPAHLECVFVFG